jgi:hypothetical protein
VVFSQPPRNNQEQKKNYTEEEEEENFVNEDMPLTSVQVVPGTFDLRGL